MIDPNSESANFRSWMMSDCSDGTATDDEFVGRACVEGLKQVHLNFVGDESGADGDVCGGNQGVTRIGDKGVEGEAEKGSGESSGKHSGQGGKQGGKDGGRGPESDGVSATPNSASADLSHWTMNFTAALSSDEKGDPVEKRGWREGGEESWQESSVSVKFELWQSPW